jgi:hypothetical protein
MGQASMRIPDSAEKTVRDIRRATLGIIRRKRRSALCWREKALARGFFQVSSSHAIACDAGAAATRGRQWIHEIGGCRYVPEKACLPLCTDRDGQRLCFNRRSPRVFVRGPRPRSSVAPTDDRRARLYLPRAYRAGLSLPLI